VPDRSGLVPPEPVEHLLALDRQLLSEPSGVLDGGVKVLE
jgi:hypothetical protein